MELILLEKVANLGDLGDRVRVRPGYGRNYLLPYGKAKPATAENIRYFEERRAELEARARDAFQAAQARLEQLQGRTLTIQAKAGEQGKLFGSVGPADIANAAEAAGIELARREVRMPEGPIRVAGSYEVAVQLHTDVEGVLSIVVEGQE
ncbi:50S ribosomal protein L9 [Halorhodospira abdelmalekii]|uniref:50S ribosomal protein L9 n=1 Tax=Halorhodospira abdelmalekii TaxID=421629 RepID=UPI0019061F40|nr:50S ribosomal protein L9 [Halorhodospira abdelmalekii]MBK1735313.1 50S ribosomal protein L9 [Halorhodospira abdelmalekii]